MTRRASYAAPPGRVAEQSPALSRNVVKNDFIFFSAPDPQIVHLCGGGEFQQGAQTVAGNPARDDVRWNPVCPFGKHADPVDEETEHVLFRHDVPPVELHVPEREPHIPAGLFPAV